MSHNNHCNFFFPTHAPNSYERKFWVVWSPQGQAPSVRHESHAKAAEEARRLAEREPDRHFYVLVAEKRIALAQPAPQFAEEPLQ